MVPFTEDEFAVGMIAWFTIDQLREHEGIRRTGGSSDDKPRPFVAYDHDVAGNSYWTALTTEKTQSKRTGIDKDWLRRAVGRLKNDPVVVNDGRHTYAGPVIDFATMSQEHDTFEAARRPYVTDEGIEAVRAAVEERGGLLPD